MPKRRNDVALKNWQCSRECIAQLLPSLTKTCLHKAPQTLLVVRAQGECISACPMLKQQDRRVDSRHGIKRLPWHPRNDGGRRSRLHKCGEIRPVARCRRDALRHLQLHQQNNAGRRHGEKEQSMQQWACDVIRDIRNHTPTPAGWCE